MKKTKKILLILLIMTLLINSISIISTAISESNDAQYYTGIDIEFYDAKTETRIPFSDLGFAVAVYDENGKQISVDTTISENSNYMSVNNSHSSFYVIDLWKYWGTKSETIDVPRFQVAYRATYGAGIPEKLTTYASESEKSEPWANYDNWIKTDQSSVVYNRSTSINNEMILCIDVYLTDSEKTPDNPSTDPTPKKIDLNTKVEGLKVETTTHENIGNSIDIVPGEEGLSDSLKVYEMKDLIKNSGNEITSIKNVNGEDLQENSLIGTGTTINLADGSKYTAIVYGDGTGDGEINSSDMAVIINSFLNDSKIENYFYLASDVSQDGSLDSLDIARMVKHFLGTETGEILEK